MSKKTDDLMLKLPLDHVAEWLKAELEDWERKIKRAKSHGEGIDAMHSVEAIMLLLAKLGH